MEHDANRFALQKEQDLDLDLDFPAATNTTQGTASEDTLRESMLELELVLEQETRDISARFQSERRPEPEGLDRALSDNYNNGRSQRNTGTSSAPQKYASKSGGFVTGFDPLSKEELAKKASREQRFGAIAQVQTQSNPEMNDDQGTGMDVDSGEWTRPENLPEAPPRTSTIRPEAVHLYGTDEMSTKDVLKYFEAYGPSHVEWIDDSSCNVVFLDQFSAKRALYFQLVDRNVNFGEDDVLDTAQPEGTTDGGALQGPTSNNQLQRAKDYIPVQQQHQPLVRNNRGLFVRYATDYDRKERGAAARSTYYAIHGREESKPGDHSSSSTGSSRYGRRSRADEDEIWNRGRGITSFSRLRRKIEDGESPSPSPTRHRSWSRNRRLAGSRSRSASRSRSRSRYTSRSPERSSGRERASHSPESNGRLRADDYENRGRRGDISSRLGGRVKAAVDEEKVENRINQYADDFLAELESTFSRQEKAIPKTKMYSDFYEREIVSESPTESLTTAGGRSRRDNRESGRSRMDDGRLFSGSSSSAPRSKGRDRRNHGRQREEALKALDARLGLPSEERVDEFGRSRKNEDR